MSRPQMIAIAGVIVGVVAIAVAIGLSIKSTHQEAPRSKAPAAAPSQEQPGKPSFDVVRINPQGETVIAGRATPKAEVAILDGGAEIGRVIADARGEWVFVPDHPLPPGTRELTLQAKNPDGTTGKTDSPVVLHVPDRKNGAGQALAVKVKPDGSLEVLTGPAAGEGAGDLQIVGVRYDSNDRLAVTGKSKARAHLMVYLDDKLIGKTHADGEGRWHVAPKLNLTAGDHKVRADDVGADGKVLARVEVDFSPQGTLPADGKVTVEPGNSLWRIARRLYGTGVEYMAIYRANKEQIRDPNLIYPGQVIEVPAK